jgi:hypothetical protein
MRSISNHWQLGTALYDVPKNRRLVACNCWFVFAFTVCGLLATILPYNILLMLAVGRCRLCVSYSDFQFGVTIYDTSFAELHCRNRRSHNIDGPLFGKCPPIPLGMGICLIFGLFVSSRSRSHKPLPFNKSLIADSSQSPRQLKNYRRLISAESDSINCRPTICNFKPSSD